MTAESWEKLQAISDWNTVKTMDKAEAERAGTFRGDRQRRWTMHTWQN